MEKIASFLIFLLIHLNLCAHFPTRKKGEETKNRATGDLSIIIIHDDNYLRDCIYIAPLFLFVHIV